MEVEPWLRGSLAEVEPLRRAVVHALQMAAEDVERWCAALGDAEMFARPAGLPPVAFQLRHIARSLDRLLSYAEGLSLSAAQMSALQGEMDVEGSAAEVLREFREGLERAVARVLAFGPEQFGEERGVGRSGLPSTVAGLLIHCAEHTQRHVGQAITTAKVVASGRSESGMSMVPVVKCSDLERSVRFYTQVLDFERKWPGYEEIETANGVAGLVKDGAELQLSRHAGDGVFGSLQRVFVEDVDERYATFRARGLETTGRPESPVHTAPVDQTWGLREFGVGDPDGNGLCFCAPVKHG